MGGGVSYPNFFGFFLYLQGPLIVFGSQDTRRGMYLDTSTYRHLLYVLPARECSQELGREEMHECEGNDVVVVSKTRNHLEHLLKQTQTYHHREYWQLNTTSNDEGTHIH